MESEYESSSHIPVSTTLAAAARPNMEPRMLGALHILEAANSFTELQFHDSPPYSPGPAYVTGATRSQTDPQVLAFMERILQVLNSIKHTQQAHLQYFNELLSNADSAAPHPHGLPDLPFSNVADVLAYEENLETDRQPS
ncbi:uncharacterized protein LOC119397004 [Rhipicephalus sanguineus]|uniref:uncharacterized protein LOC119374834 n=1 Tax=Rhipicephalus sanguineus TaxID=34632 RepID=UPI001893AF11|nr:uncharacterized protein LOC119374834 [Rhipicephalus sanguineus]XP_037503237.1 uncharacterized protein LOC119378064 [Rhipicephalus sanguineus]XP_037503970.1 uncharacterized protein LOC119378945 [Rhipicephalus sanguineus]XP_037513580.1 uncharacterized protein LOC119390104 [Rhipicephalus sanguineus]XP_037520347.1 uncharacterized protein LOC119397004 [Rhipicephalus sanguineus]